MFCNKCGNQLNDGAKFCSKCGAPIGSEINNNNQDNIQNNTVPTVSNEAIENNNAKESGVPDKKKKGAKAVILAIAIVFGILIIITRLASCAKEPSSQTSGTQTQADSAISEVAQPTEEPPIQLDMPELSSWMLNGEVYELNWDVVPNATGYEVMIVDQGSVLTSNNWIDATVKEGETINLQIRAVGDSEKIIASEWSSYNIYMPVIDYTQINEYSAMLLSLDQLKKWATTNGYEYSVLTEGDTTILSIQYKDELNSGFMNGVGRTLSGLADGLLGGAQEELTAESILPSAVEKYIDNGSLKETMKEQVKDSTSEIGWSGLRRGFDYLFMDTAIHYDYLYLNDSLNKSAYIGTISLLEMQRENYKTLHDENYDKYESDGVV